MSDIKKELRLVATLDDSAFKRQIEALKKSMGKDLSFDAQSLNGLKDVFKDFGKQVQELKKAIEGLKAPRGAGAPDSDGISMSRGSKKRSYFDPASGRYVRIGQGETYDPQSRRVFKSENDLASFKKLQEEKSRKSISDAEFKDKQKMLDEEDRRRSKMLATEEREKAKQSVREQRERDKALKEEAKAKDKERKADERRRADIRDARSDKFGAQNERWADLREKLQAYQARKNQGTPPSDNGEDSGMDFKKMALKGGKISAAAMGVAMGYYTLKDQYYDRRDRGLLDVSHGKALEGMSRQIGRGRLAPQGIGGGIGGLGGAAAGLGLAALLGLSGPIGWGIAGVGALAGAYGGRNLLSNRAGESSVKNMAVLNAAFDKAQPQIGTRLEAMGGGGINSKGLSGLQMSGASMGFSGEATLSQFLAARGTLGNKGAAEALPGLQQQNRLYGVDVNTGIQARDIIAGTGHTSSSAANAQIVETLKKGVAGGLDVSRSGKFLQAAAENMSKFAGIGSIDTDSVSSNLSSIMGGLVGMGGNVTSTTVDQAKRLQAMISSESTSTSGFSGIGNIVGIQNAFSGAGANLDSGTMLALMNAGSNASDDTYNTILNNANLGDNVDRGALIKSLRQASSMNQLTGFGATGIGGNLQLALGGRERGITTGEQISAIRGQAMIGTAGVLNPNAAEDMNAAGQAVTGSNEFKYQQAVSQFDVSEITAGLETMGDQADYVSDQLKELGDRLKSLVDEFASYKQQLGVVRETH